MSLVAYAASSDEDESDCEDETMNDKTNEETAIGHISDEDEDYTPEASSLLALKKPQSLLLPKPKQMQSLANELDDFVASTFAKLPMPKGTGHGREEIIENEDDEFLRKKPMPLANEPNERPPPPSTTIKGPVRITIPSIRDFSDVDRDLARKNTNKTSVKPQGSGLLSILPKAKSEQNFAKPSSATAINMAVAPSRVHVFIPDTVKNRRPAHNTEDFDGIKKMTAKKKKNASTAENSKVTPVDSDEDDEDEDLTGTSSGDFFSLNAAAEELPEVSVNEINAMVAKRAARIEAVATKFSEVDNVETIQQECEASDELRLAQKRYHNQKLNEEGIQALVGSSAKRRRGGRQQQPDIHLMDISSDQVLPNRDEWMRNALASSTTYQPTGVLNDEEPAAGTRRKHQITYLAHKAKSNEAELQAMWAANRQNRRATQSKYGF